MFSFSLGVRGGGGDGGFVGYFDSRMRAALREKETILYLYDTWHLYIRIELAMEGFVSHTIVAEHD